MIYAYKFILTFTLKSVSHSSALHTPRGLDNWSWVQHNNSAYLSGYCLFDGFWPGISLLYFQHFDAKKSIHTHTAFVFLFSEKVSTNSSIATLQMGNSGGLREFQSIHGTPSSPLAYGSCPSWTHCFLPELLVFSNCFLSHKSFPINFIFPVDKLFCKTLTCHVTHLKIFSGSLLSIEFKLQSCPSLTGLSVQPFSSPHAQV